MPKKVPSTNLLHKAFEEEKKINSSKLTELGLSEAQKLELVERVCYDVEQDTAARKPYLDKVLEIMDLYEGKVQKAPAYEGAANVSTRIVTMAVELLHSILLPAIWNEDLHSWRPVESSDISTSEAVNTFMQWDYKYTKIIQFIDDYIKSLILEGTVCTKTRWVEEWNWVQKKIPKEGSIMKKTMKMIKSFINGRDNEVTLDDGDFDIEYAPHKMEYCTTDIIPLEDVGFPPFQAPASQEKYLDHIWHRTYPYIYELQELEMRGLIEKGACDAIGTCIEGKVVAEIAAEHGTARQRLDSEGSRQVQFRKDSTPLNRIEWYGKYKIGDSWEEIVVWVEKTSKTFLGAALLRRINQLNKRPIKISQFIRRLNRMYGMSLGEMVYEYQKILDEMQNVTLNAGKYGAHPAGFYRAASGYNPEKIVVQPGIMVPVDDINDVKMYQIPNNVLVTHQEMRFVMELVEKITSIGAYQSGQESDTIRTRATARGTLALIAQGERRFVVLGKRIQYQLAEILKAKLEYYQQNIPPGFADKILGQDGNIAFPEGLDPADIAGQFDLNMNLDATGGSKSQDLQLASDMYNAYSANPLVQEDPARFWEVSAAPLRKAGIVNIDAFLGPKPKTLEERAKEQGMEPEQYKLALAQQQVAAAAGQAGAPGGPPPPSAESPSAAPSEPAPAQVE